MIGPTRASALFALLLCFATSARAADVVVSWDAPQFRDNGDALNDLAGYRVHWGRASRIYDFQRDAGTNRSFTVRELSAGATYYFSVTAYDSAGVESDYSVEGRLTLSAPPGGEGSRSAPLDYDGDGVSDVVLAATAGRQKVFRLHLSETGSTAEVVFGAPADRPIGGDFDGDGRYDIALVKSTKRSLQWTIRRSIDGSSTVTVFGRSGDTPVGGCDLDGDRKDDLVVVRGERLLTKRSSDAGVTVRRIKLLQNLVSLRCAAIRPDQPDSVAILAHAPAKKTKSGRVRKSRSGGGPLVIAVASASGKISSQYRSSRLGDIVALDLNGDGTREPAALGRERGSAILRFFAADAPKGLPVALGISSIQDIAPARLRGNDGEIHDGLIITTRNGRRYLFNLSDLESLDFGDPKGDMPATGGRKLRRR